MIPREIIIAFNSASHESVDLILCGLCELDICHIRIDLHGKNSVFMLHVAKPNMDSDFFCGKDCSHYIKKLEG